MACALLITTVGASPTDPMQALNYLVGTWTCSYVADAQPVKYAATFSYAMGGNWIRERDSWNGGSGDEGLLTYDPQLHRWTTVVLERRTTTLFIGTGKPTHVLYRTIYPNENASEIFDKVSPTKFTVHFTMVQNHKTMSSVDTCIKR